MPSAFSRNTLFYGDNLAILREYVADQSIDLIYLDPPFNSNRSYNVLFKDESGKESQAQIEAFDDAWHWDRSALDAYLELLEDAPAKVSKMIQALHDFIGENQMMAYLVMMTARLVELHRVLKPTGSLYLHCDPTASHYLKVILDAIFGADKFVNEISWKRSGRRSAIYKIFRRAHDIVFLYSKTDEYIFNMVYEKPDDTLLEKYSQVDERGKYQLVPLMASGKVNNGETGKPWRGYDPNIRGKGGMHWLTTHDRLEQYVNQNLVVFPKNPDGAPRLKYYLDQNKGVPISDFWDDIDIINSMGNESLGYPTQKPMALLERIIQASSNPGDVVLDPFCGCGTAVAAANKLGRRWVGIDITHLAITLQKYRLKDAFNIEAGKDYQVIGEPVSVDSARQLAQDDRYQFQWWALSLVGAKPLGGDGGGKQGKKGKDQGIDGVITFVDDPKKGGSTIQVQVKSGHVSSQHIRDLRGVLDREKSEMGVYITLEPPTGDMAKEALAAGYYISELWQKSYPKIQILTIEQLLNGVEVQMPPARGSFKKAQKIQKSEGKQGELGI